MSGAQRTQTWRGCNALYVARKLGLSNGLKLCLDAGDSVSLPAASATWNDLSGNGHHFDFGAGGAAPSINGTAGQLVAGNYLGFDGGDYLTLASSNPSWVQNLHKDNALFTIAVWHYHANNNGGPFFANAVQSSGQTGIRFRNTSTGGPNTQLVVSNGSSVVLNASHNSTVVQDAWNFAMMSIDEAANVRNFRSNTVAATGGATYSSPATGDAHATTQIGAAGGGNAPLQSGSRVGMLLVWEGAPLVPLGQMSAFFNATRGRYGV